MDCTNDEYWLGVLQNTAKEKVTSCKTLCIGGTELGGIRVYVKDHIGSSTSDFLHQGAPTYSQGIGLHA
jgi:hypothetical protein